MSEMTTEKFETYAKNAGEPRWFTEKRSAAFDKAKGLPTPEAWGDYKRIISERYPEIEFAHTERFAFYELCRKASVVFVTGESRTYGNILITKGIVF